MSARLAALGTILRAWNDLDHERIDQAEYDRLNTAAAAVLGEDAAEALSTLTTRERWASDDCLPALRDRVALALVLRRVDAVVAEART